MPDASTRREALSKFVETFDEKVFDKSVDLSKEKIVAIERDAQTSDTYLSTHKNLRAACDYLASTVGMGYQPEFLLDLDTGERHDLDLIAFVTPKSVDGVGVLLPRSVAQGLADYLGNGSLPHEAAVLKQARSIIQRSLGG